MHCTSHMAQLRHDYPKFQALNTEVLVLIPNGPVSIERYARSQAIPYPILTDKGSRVASQYSQIKMLFSLGTPTVFLVGKGGKILYTHYAISPLDEPDNREPLEVLEKSATAGWDPT